MEHFSNIGEKIKESEKINEYFMYFIIISGFLIIQLPLPFEINKNGVYLVAAAFLPFLIIWKKIVPKKYIDPTKNFIESTIVLIGLFVVVNLTGGIRSFFTVLYFLPILNSAAYMPLRATVGLTALTSILILAPAFLSLGQEDLSSTLSIAALQIWAVWLISAYGRYLIGEIHLTKKSEEEVKLEEVHEIEKLKDEFIFIISHELRTPITVIRGYLELLIDGAVGKIDAKSRAVLEKAFSTSNKLSNLISLLLEAARLETGKINFLVQDNNSIEESFERVRYNLEGDIERKNIDLNIKIPSNLKVRADNERLEEILNIIAGNAVTYTPEFGKVDITARKVKDKVKIEVSDNGVGMPEEKREKLFEKFYTEETGLGDKTIKGINIGMYVVKQLLLKMDGDVSVESKVGEGTKFTFELPAPKNTLVKAIIFDAGGVLFNSEESLFTEPIKYVAKVTSKPRRIVDTAYRETIKECESEEIDKKIFWRKLTEKLGVKIKYSGQDPISAGFKKFKQDEEVLSLIRKLKTNYKIALVSNANTIEASNPKAKNIYNEFDEVILSFKIGVRKPYPKIYQTVFNRLKIKPEETVFVDNAPENVTEAKVLGMNGLLFKNANQLKIDLLKFGVRVRL